MKKQLFRIIFIAFTSVSFIKVNAQKLRPFWDEISDFKKSDSIHFPPANAILFEGSSSFRKWTDVADYFPGYTIVNRGFGGSTLPDVTAYAKDIIYPYHPKQVVIYCGDNDLAASNNITDKIVLSRFKELYKKIRLKYPKVSILFVSIKPSPSRRKLMPAIVSANSMIKKFLTLSPHNAFADVYHPMLNKNGQPMPEIFLSDSLHMNAKGYAIWQHVMKPYLVKTIKK